MAILTRPKHITSSLDDRLRALLLGEFPAYSTSSGTDNDDDSTSALLNDFLDSPADQTNDPNTEEPDSSPPTPIKYSSSTFSSSSSSAAKLRELLSPPPSADPFRSRLVTDVEAAASAVGTTGPGFRRAVMGRLRERGYDAGICKARWEGGGGLTAGSYEYIDVVFLAEGGRRYIVDLGFKGEFEVARETEEYGRLKEVLPEVVVVEAEGVRAAVRIMAEAGRRSLKSRGMSVPPWRKKRYMMAKWFGFYRRTVNVLGVEKGGEVRWRAVGFGCAGDN